MRGRLGAVWFFCWLQLLNGTASQWLQLLNVTQGNAAGCGGNLTAPTGGPVTSPNYPSNYGNNENCEWLITVPVGSIISLTFDSFNTEENYDFLDIYDGASDSAAVIQRLTGQQSVSRILSTSNSMFLRFTSDGFVTHQGFQFSYTSLTSNETTGCGGNLTTPTGGPVTSTNYPSNYGNNENCEWLITVPVGSIISLTFDSFNTEENYDFLDIYDGASDSAAVLQRLTGQQSVSPVNSTSNKMFLRFTSDGTETRQGFQFSYTSLTSNETKEFD
ncbi:PREDICTED: tolloid-like protein 2 [Branchiostoma belcheri]|uniref:Tolloid-like protein 2 n=1 Tax=Branchiostoma belcheri TaxID=7741 RepID=A0A6P4XZK1_BRABE|nr:PREDICTED: tolloid-like protein 2 [Branchiostoma belcheri]